jgi:hypothetical protein
LWIEAFTPAVADQFRDAGNLFSTRRFNAGSRIRRLEQIAHGGRGLGDVVDSAFPDGNHCRTGDLAGCRCRCWYPGAAN